MSGKLQAGRMQSNYTYPEFVIDERTGQVRVNVIDMASGQVVRHIPPTEVNKIVQSYTPISRDASH